MKNILILYNPYYQKDAIDQHLQLLIENEKVAFGKVRSKLNNLEQSFENDIDMIYQNCTEQSHIQLFLTDYANLFVAKVIEVTDDDMSSIAPYYYQEKGLEVEKWFVISDMRELVRNDFEIIRDNYLSKFTTPSFANHTYALYGNRYEYPLIIDMKKPIDYFEDKSMRHYPDIYKTKEFLDIKEALIKYSFGSKYINLMHPDTMSSIISAEMEYHQNIQNPLYDFSSVVINYTKTYEQEMYMLAKIYFKYLSKLNPSILNITYSVQGREYTISDMFTHKPNIGTYKKLFSESLVQEIMKELGEDKMYLFNTKTLGWYSSKIQGIRNATVHEKPASLDDADSLREMILGIESRSAIISIIMAREYFTAKSE